MKSKKLLESTMLALQGKLAEGKEHNLSKDLFGNEADKRMNQRQKNYEKHLQYVKDIMAGKEVIDDRYHEKLDLDTAKKWLKDDYVHMNNLMSYSPDEVNEKLAKDLPEIFGTKKTESAEGEKKYKEEIYNLLHTESAGVEKVGGEYSNCFKYNGYFVELRPETTVDDNDVPEMDFAVFATEDDMNTDYESNITTDYFDIENPRNYWKFVKKTIDGLAKQPEKKTEAITQVESFYVGDPCYVLGDDIYYKIWGDKYGFKDGIIQVNKKLSFEVHGTAYGDGEYFDDRGNRYLVDSGTIALVPVDIISKPNGLNNGKVFEGNQGTLAYDDGVFTVIIDGKTVAHIYTKTTDDEDEELEESKKHSEDNPNYDEELKGKDVLYVFEDFDTGVDKKQSKLVDYANKALKLNLDPKKDDLKIARKIQDLSANKVSDMISDCYGNEIGNRFEQFLDDSLETLDTSKIKYIKESKTLTEAEIEDEPAKVYMNTWKNYNEYGADLELYDNIDGWMDTEAAKEFTEKHAEDEPFINDTDNLPWSVSEYDNVESQLDYIEKYNDLDENEKKAFIAILEDQNDNLEMAFEILDSGDFIFFEDVDDDDELGRAYVDMCGGIDAAVPKDRIENYIDEEAYRESWEEVARNSLLDDEPDLEEDSEEFDEKLEEYTKEIADEQLALALAEGQDLSDYFDYEALGRDLNFEGYYYAKTGAINVL